MTHVSHKDPKLERMRWIFTLASLAVLLAGLYAVLNPFMVPLTWAAIIVLSTWPIFSKLLELTGGRRILTASIMTFVVTLVLVAAIVPMFIAAAAEIETITKSLNDILSDDEFQLPTLLTQLPLFGPSIEHRFLELRNEREKVIDLIQNYQEVIIQFVTIAAKGIFSAVAKTIMCLFTVFFLYLHGESLAKQLATALYGIGGEQFKRLLYAVRSTVKGAVYGILVTAVTQGILAGIGYYFAGAPLPLLMGFATIVFSLVPFGTPFIYIPLSLYVGGALGDWPSAIALLVWCVAVVSSIDNVLRPLFISQATRMPLLLVFLGVIGGALAFGLVGLFIGPALLAIAQVLWNEWIEHREHVEA